MIPFFPLLLLALVAYLSYSFYQSWSKLRKFPGPSLACFTDLWQVYDYYWTYRSDPVRPLHDEYGPVVRMGPNKLYFSHPSAIQDIFGLKRNLKKSEYYAVSAPTQFGHVVTNMYASTDGDYHDKIRRAVQMPFNNSSLISYEEPVNDVINKFFYEIDRRFADKTGNEGVFDMADWCHYFSLDSVSTITYSKPYGFLDAGSDVNDMIKGVAQNLTYQSGVGQAPWLDRVLLKNPVLLWLQSKGYFSSVNPIVLHALGAQGGRLQEDAEAKAGKEVTSTHYNDILNKLIQAKAEKPDIVSDEEILKVSIAVVFAGADSTATLLAAIFYYLVQHPEVYTRLEREIDGAFLLSTPITYAAAIKLQYLDAVIKESMRMFPVVRFTVERVTPPQGITICGEHVPGDTVVGANPWATHRNKELFGDDVDTFRPERWLESGQRYVQMREALFLFGAGKYSCLGQNISNMETWKFVPACIRKYRFVDAREGKPWKYEQGLFVNVRGVSLKATKRHDI